MSHGPRGAAAAAAHDGRWWIRAGTLVVLLASAAGATGFLVTAPSADCRTVRAAVSYIHDRRGLIDTAQIDSGPPLSEYVAWADALQRYAEATSSVGPVETELDAIAERARHAMGLVSLARDNPAPAGSPSQQGISGGFAANVTDIVDAENRALAACHLG